MLASVALWNSNHFPDMTEGKAYNGWQLLCPFSHTASGNLFKGSVPNCSFTARCMASSYAEHKLFGLLLAGIFHTV
jgi:hypothetical protein